ncbi:MAG: NAD(P)H-dependent oxidoreductase subunit E [Nitrospinae bacterium]|nr:NAD(P)H-dependent oxidoreductase subunit E [Nitrospinota bacterium]
MLVFTQEEDKKIEKIIGKYPVKQSALLPLLTLVQRRDGYINPDAMKAIGQKLNLSPAYVQSVMSFYTMYHAHPTGKYIILFCHNISCQLNGADELLKYTSEKLGIEVGGTTTDKKFTLHREECLAACCGGPMMRVNDTFYENLTRTKIDRILDALP